MSLEIDAASSATTSIDEEGTQRESGSSVASTTNLNSEPRVWRDLFWLCIFLVHLMGLGFVVSILGMNRFRVPDRLDIDKYTSGISDNQVGLTETYWPIFGTAGGIGAFMGFVWLSALGLHGIQLMKISIHLLTTYLAVISVLCFWIKQLFWGITFAVGAALQFLYVLSVIDRIPFTMLVLQKAIKIVWNLPQVMRVAFGFMVVMLCWMVVWTFWGSWSCCFYKGVLPNGKEIAVKSLKSGSGQGEREFQAEVEIISRVHHRHLVSLVGYCISGSQRMLVYEFVPNNTLEFHLHGKDRPVMDFSTRLKIALGSAKGLAYLHEDCHPRIIHRDIKTANILLDYNFEAMVADFGLAKLSSDTHTHVSTRVMGTFGYLAPEYASSGKLTEKSDVFSFGVMLLELITGHRPVNSMLSEDSLVDWARPLLSKALSNGNFEELADPKLENKFSTIEMSHLAASAAACVRHSISHTKSKISE